MGVLDGKVAFISGAARGQGRAHAVRLAQEGADIIGFDICEQVDSCAYLGSTEDDLEQTIKLVEDLGRKIVVRKADVRDFDEVKAVLDAGVEELGRVDIVLANAGIMPVIGEPSKRVEAWHDAVDIMLTGAMHTCEAAIPTLLAQGQGGAMVITSSLVGFRAPMRTLDMKSYGLMGYISAKHAIVGLMRAYANALGPYGIRVNTVHPTGCNTPMVANPEFGALAQEQPEFMEAMRNILPVPMVEPEDIANAVLFLCSDAGRYVTGVAMPVDAGAAAY